MTRSISLYALCLSAALLGAPRAHAAPQPPKRSPELFLAIGQGDAAAVKALLAEGADANCRNTLDISPLTIAAGTGNVEIVKALLAAGADVNHTSAFGNALTFAAMETKPEVAKLLLERGARVASGRPDRISILMLAARGGDPGMIRLLLAKGAELSAVDNHGSTALSHAARAGQAEAVSILLAAGAKVDVPDADGWTPLMHASVNGHAAVVERLLAKSASPRARDKKGRTALHLTTSFGDHPEVVRALLKGGAELEAKDVKGRTALALASARGYAAAAGVLGERGARAIPVAAALRTPRQAAEQGLRQVEHAMQVFAKRTGCASCHHEGIARFTTGFAQARGYKINAAFAKEQEKRVLGQYGEMLPLLRKAVENPAETKNVPIVDVGDLAPTNGTLLLGLAEHRTPANEALAAAAVVLARTQTPDGDWRFGFMRVPVQSSFFSTTAMTVRALRAYAPTEHAAEMEGRIARARQWLLAAPVKDTEDRVFRLLGLKWAGATAEERRKAMDELRSTQRPDGGWGQLDRAKSDAYATGSALFALAQGGELPVTDPVYQRGVQFLLRTQEDDGTWYVYKRAIPANNYFDAEYPYGQSQYSSHMGACWATMALMLAAEAPAAPQQAAR
ncbi:MAG TPA: ankyrin repeat domain-containing protein [Armatimonadota bacterium]|nr:ankyrin repeat domain-containing protein [Armatimonadota bacterium]